MKMKHNINKRLHFCLKKENYVIMQMKQKKKKKLSTISEHYPCPISC